MSNKKAYSLYMDKDIVKHTKILLLNRDDSPSFSQLVENLLNLTIEKALESDEKWLKPLLTKTSGDKGPKTS